MKIYLSHSIPPDETRLLPSLAGLAERFGIDVFLAKRPWPAPSIIPEDAALAIETSDCLLLWLMNGGTSLSFSNLETGYVRNACQNVPILIVAEEGAPAPGCVAYRDKVQFNLNHPWPALEKAFHVLRHDYKFAPREQKLLAGFITSGIGLALLRSAPAAQPSVVGAAAGALS